MLQAFRRSPRLATLLILALVAGPAAAALCSHTGAMPEAAGEMDHSAMAETPEALPCHEAPAPEPEPDADCLSPCCAVSAPSPVTPPLALNAPPSVPLAPAVDAPLATETVAPVTPEPAPPPGAPVRVHLLLGRFLT